MDEAARSEALRRLFDEALETEPLAALTEAEDLDPDLARELRELLAAHEAVGSRFDALDPVVAAALLAEDPGEPTLEGQAVGRFLIERRIGSGGMGTTYLAHDPELERNVAVKVLHRPAGGSRAAEDQLLEEARATSALDHPSIATVFDAGRLQDGRAFMALAYYEGETLAARIARGPLSVPDAIRIARRVAAGLAAAHERGIVHRDIKPANIMLLPDASVRILDFGIAGRAENDRVVGGPGSGTIRYMSPERLGGERGDERSDVWALGAVLVEMLAGRSPFEGATDAEVMGRIASGTPVPETLTAIPGRALRRLIRHCLATDPADRPQSGAALVEALDGLRRVTRRRRNVVAAAAVLGSAVGGWAVLNGDPLAVHPAATVLAVLPPVPVTPDSALQRVGRDLAVMIALNLEGVGAVRTLDPTAVLRLPVLQDRDADESARVRAALEMGATGVVTGTALALDDQVRVDLQLIQTPGGAPLARASLVRPADDLVGLTDSLSWALVEAIWRVDDPPTPSIEGLTTRSFPALRAFLDGERAVQDGRFREAPTWFARAVAQDSTFWLAYWRLWWTSDWHGQPPGDGVREAVLEHLDALPERDAALVRARAVGSQVERHRLLREAAATRPFDWLAWFALQDFLVHDGGFLGHPLADSREALERVVRLHPELVRGWDHLFWVVREQRDTLRMREVLARLDALSYDRVSVAEGGFDDLYYMQVQERMVLGGDRIDPRDLGPAVRLMTGVHGFGARARMVSNPMSEGFSRAQLQLADALLHASPDRSMQAAVQLSRSLALAMRGQWDEALDAAEAYLRAAPGGEAALHGTRLAAIGAAVGGLDPGRAQVWHARAASGPDPTSPETEAELLWLRGLSAWAERDARGLEVARNALDAMGDPAARLLRGSLGALAVELEGDRPAAADLFAGLLLRHADGADYRRMTAHPYHDGLSRLLASRWLQASGRSEEAEALLTWYEAVLPDGPLWMIIRANRILEPLAHLERARIAARTDSIRARWHLDRALEHLEDPDPVVAAAVTEARSTLSIPVDPGGT